MLSGDPGEMPAAVSSTPAAIDDAALIRAAQRGDEEAFERLVRARDRAVLRLALSLLRSPEDARDVYQESFLRVYRNLHRFRHGSSFQTWLYRIVTNLCLDQLRKRKARREEAAGGGERLEMLRERRAESDPHRKVLSGEIAERLEALLEQLSFRERAVFELRHYHGLRLREIGDVLGTSEEAAKNCLFRATRKLRAGLGDLL